MFFFFFCVVFYSLAAEGEVAIHPCKVLLICPAEAGHAAVLNSGSAVLTRLLNTVHSDPEVGMVAALLKWRDLDSDLVRNTEVDGQTLTELWCINNIA
ncbi:MAG: hypothetical protein EBS96_12650, partial [Spartobacteria bacterium]|nr:hypothetical protein [Spartobacteria bacterium]